MRAIGHDGTDRRRSSPWIISGSLAVAATLWVASGLIGGEPERGSDAEVSTQRLAEVRVRDQSARDVSRHIEVYGRLEPARSVTVRAETDGRVEQIHADRGARVEAGEPLFRLNERDRAARLRTARALVAQREIEHRAQQRLKDDDYISESNLAAAATNLETARGELKRAELDLGYMTVSAPFDGALQDRMVELGDYVRAGDAVAEFVDDRSLIVAGTVSERDIGRVAVGDPGIAKLVTGEEREGRIRYVAPVADAGTRTFRVELVLDNPEGSLRAGVTAEMLIDGGRISAHRISPALMTLNDAGELGVKVVDDQDRIRFHPIEIVASGVEGIWVTGLPQQARIVTVGQGWAQPGEQVRAVAEERDEAASLAGS